jgi:hypothetical protein
MSLKHKNSQATLQGIGEPTCFRARHMSSVPSSAYNGDVSTDSLEITLGASFLEPTVFPWRQSQGKSKTIGIDHLDKNINNLARVQMST